MSVLLSLIERFKEPSSWAGIGGLLVLFNVNLDPGLLDKVTIVAAGLAWIAAFFLREKTEA